MTETMIAGISTERGIEIASVPVPAVGEGQVLVKVASAGMNRADLAAARGAYGAASLGNPIGMEWAGEIIELGKGVSGLSVGQAVMCMGSGGYAEYAVADARRCIVIGDSGFDMAQAAILPLVLMTAHDAVVTNGRLSAGEALLVQGASSAVGLMSMQIGRKIGARMIGGVSGNASKRARLSEFGATHTFDAASAEFSDEVIAASGGTGVNVVVDMVSGEAVNALMKATAVLGRLVNVGRLGGASAAFDFDLHAARRLSYIGVTFRTRSPDEVAAIVARMRADLWEDVLAGSIGLPIDARFTLADVASAHDHMAKNAHFGKIALLV